MNKTINAHKKIIRLLFCLAGTIILISCASTKKTAPDKGSPVAEFPKYNLGDKYIIDVPVKKQLHRHTWTVSKVNDDGTIEIHQDCETKDLNVDSYTISKEFVFTDPGGKERWQNLRLDFPLFIGKQWSVNFKGETISTGAIASFKNTFKVTDYEVIKLQIGYYPAFKISVSQYKKDTSWKGYGTLWYSPEIKMIVKANFDWMPGVELIDYALADKIESATLASNGNRSVINAKLSAQAGINYRIDQNLVASSHENPDAIAVVIGNRDYKSTKPVSFALNDSKLIAKYLTEVFGYKEGNIFYIENASKSDFEVLFGNDKTYKGKLFNAVKEGKSDVFVYYTGHGAPGLKDRKGYFVPVEADPQYLELTGYPADVFYKNLSKLPAKYITVVIDACFSGASVFDNISPMVFDIEKPVVAMPNGVILSSSSGSQVSSWYNEKEHGMFTYFFLKAIHNKNADADNDNQITFDEIFKYVSDRSEGVPYYARRILGVEQNPTIEGAYQNKVFIDLR